MSRKQYARSARGSLTCAVSPRRGILAGEEGRMARAAEVDVAGWAEAVEAYFERGWTDGLPVVPATPEAIRPFLAVAGLEPGDIVLTEATRRRSISAEKVAINAVMAGCRPEYMPVLLAALRGHGRSRVHAARRDHQHGRLGDAGRRQRSDPAAPGLQRRRQRLRPRLARQTPRSDAPSGSSRSTASARSPACSIARRRGTRASTRTASQSWRKRTRGSRCT